MAKSEIISGTSPIRLNRKGRDQAEDLAHTIVKGGGMHMIVSSDLPRAVDTAKIVGKATGAPVQTSKGLHPWHLGELEGKPEAESEAVVQHHARSMPWAPLPGKSPESGVRGESYNSFKDRLLNQTKDLQDLARAHPGKKIAAVTHSRSIHLIRAALKSKDGKPDVEDFLKPEPLDDHIYHVDGKELRPMSKEAHHPPGLFLIHHTATNDDSK